MVRSVIGTSTEEVYPKGSVLKRYENKRIICFRNLLSFNKTVKLGSCNNAFLLFSLKNVESKKMMKNVPRIRDVVDPIVASKNISKVTVNYLARTI